MITDSERYVSSGHESFHVLVEGIVFLLALLPVVRRASLIVPATSSTVVITTLVFESILCATMLLDKIHWRRAWSQRGRPCEVATVDRGQQVGQLALDLFLSKIIYYPSWLQRSRSNVPSSIIEAVKVTFDTVKLKIRSSTYLFTFESGVQPNGDNWGTLKIFVDDSFVLSVMAALSQDRWATRGTCHTASLFIDGPWVQELFDLSAEAKECRRTRLKISGEMPEGKR